MLRSPRARRLIACGLVGCCLATAPLALAAGLAPSYSAPTPADGATGVALAGALRVGVSDPESDSLTVRFFARRPGGIPGPDFTLIGLPDTQFYVSLLYGGLPAMFRAQAQWILGQAFVRNVRYVVQLGDCTQSGDNNGNPIEWQRADTALRIIEDPVATSQLNGLPYGVCVGNHDQIGEWPGNARSYNNMFGVARFAGREYYGGHFGPWNDDWFDLFSASGIDFITIGFEFAPAPNPFILHWADSLLKAYPTRKAIVASHYLLELAVGASTPAFSTQGRAVYDSLKDNPNLILMLCAHLLGEARRTDTYQGNTVHTILANYQGRENGGNGRLRIMEFSPARSQLRVRTYSPWIDAWETDADSSSQFTLPLALPSSTSFQQLGAVRVPAGANASVPWTWRFGPAPFDWFVTVNDGASTVTSPIWRLTTVDPLPPVVHLSSPDIGGRFAVGQSIPVTWSATDNAAVQHVDVQFSRTGKAGPWQMVGPGLPNSGSFSFVPSGGPTNDGRVKVVAYDAALNSASDVSDSAFTIQTSVGVDDGPVTALALAPPAPNPAVGQARADFALPAEADVRVTVEDIQGREIALIASGRFAPGHHVVSWAGQNGRARARPGRYYLRLRSGGRTLVRTFVWLR